MARVVAGSLGARVLSVLRRWLLTTDHRVIARRYLVSGIIFLFVGGALAMLLRWQHAFPGEPAPLLGQLLFPGADGAVTPAAYSALFTTHGLIMVFFAVTPMLIGGIGTFVVPRALSKGNMSLPRVMALGAHLTFAAQLCAVASMFAPGPAPSAGWTNYPPLSTGVGAPGSGQTLLMMAIILIAIATVLGAASVIATVVTGRPPGMRLWDMPLAVWGFFLTAALGAAFAPILAAATVLLLCDRVLGTHLFGGVQGDPILYQHLFWLFGHPEVYLLVLPAWGCFGQFLGVFSGRPPFWERGQILAMVAVTAMSGLVYGHHMFRAGLGPLSGAGFELLTLLISVPGTLLFASWAMTVWRGALRLEPPMLYVFAGLVVLAVGGLSGIVLGAVTPDIWLHDTMWVVGHFHLIMAVTVLLGSFAAIHYWWPVMVGGALSRPIARFHAASSLVLSLLTFGGLLVQGYAGQPRRYFDGLEFAFLERSVGLGRPISYAAFLLGAVQVVWLFDVVRAAIRARGGRGERTNLWGAPGREWEAGDGS